MLLKWHRQPHGYLDFPYDICEHISHFLSEDDLRKLYFVSRAWYEISMPVRYKGAILKVYWGIKTKKRNYEITSMKLVPKGSSLSNRSGVYGHPSQYTPELMDYVRTLELAFGDVGHLWAPSMIKAEANTRDKICAQVARVGSWLSNPLQPLPRLPCRRPAMDLIQLATFVQNLARIDDLTFQVAWPAKNSYQSDVRSDLHLYKSIIQPFLSATLHNPGSNLRSLTLSVPMESWAFVFTPSPCINRLEKLGILICTTFPETNKNSFISQFLLPFIQQHSESLHALNVMSSHVDPALFFEKVGRFPVLRTIEAGETTYHSSRAAPSPRASLHYFLLQHRETITRFTWRFDGGGDGFGQTRTLWFNEHKTIRFPNLGALELRNLAEIGVSLYNTLIPMLRLIPSYKPTLTKLCLESYTPRLDPLYDFLTTIASPILEHLEIGSHDLPREVLARMAEQFPRLRVLHLLYHEVGRQLLVQDRLSGSYHKLDLWLSPEDQVILGVTEFRPLHALRRWQFVHDMKMLRLPDWTLEELCLETTDKVQPKQDALEVGKAVLQSIPQIILINGLHRDSYLACNSIKDLKRIQ